MYIASGPAVANAMLNANHFAAFMTVSCQLQAGSADVLAKALSVNTVLLELSFCDTRLDDSVHALALGLTPNAVLRSLSLSNNYIGRVGAASLAALLSQSIPDHVGAPRLRPLVHLDLSHNALGDAGVAEMAASLCGAHGLKHLKLVNCDIGSAGAPAGLSDKVPWHANHSFEAN